ncbi:DUF3313 domain-containing protein [Vibrio cyclitrophicus]|uniref:DUF3313 domain-containing protein n=1 Tax=Vibrio cyclitrophicus TaxID=47951 RepID=UPI000C8675CB|nr:DUF3313 domain-containing protein [Vibrio cyclitrophicus]MCC4773747.1 DUF3313 domain-containing protein [Vibrio cyclitrophicus]MCC4841951.1 DUF3313 domain-containing protein [Vibrio cyclitrophicus]PME13589.1 hypothetical protein BCV42_17490 [Vibrio cyclitrophicus]PME54027.1 hypothetical protein BCV37_09315 [Vibrio cyclitrophicus]PME82920.1 hypothetical protein BCV28_13315 [Vibrio cyclitrophicus]
MNPSKLLVLVATSIFLFGCAGGPIITETKFTTYEDFQPGPDSGVDLVWARIGLRDAQRLKSKLNSYDSVVIDQIFVLAEEGTLDPEEIEELIDHMVSCLEAKISPHKAIVGEPTGKTLRLNIALSNVETPNPILAVTSSVLPFGLAMSTISKVTTGEHTNVGSASVELLVSDAQDGTPLFAAIDREAGNKDFSTMIDSLDDAKDAINYWIERLGDTLQNIDDA